MKGFLLITTLFLAVLFSAGVQAQNVKVEEKEKVSGTALIFTGTVGGNKVDTSAWFTLNKFDNESFYVSPPAYSHKLNSVLSKPHTTVTVEATNDLQNISVVDTIGAVADSAETIQTGPLNLNNKKFLYYRLKLSGASNNPADTKITSSLYLYRKDPQ